jgi:pimeloyl-ACP methyl ester carboxylesterase
MASRIVEAWTRKGRRFSFAGHDIFVVDLPAEREAAPPVLALHGFPTSSLDWRPIVDALRVRRRVLCFDFLGFGASAKPDQRYSLFAQADLAEAVVARAGAGEVALLTHDMGDSVGGELLARDLDGALGFGIERRVLTNGSIYLDLAQLTDGQQLLRALPDERLAGPAPDHRALVGALRATLAPGSAGAAVDAELDAMAELVVHGGGSALLPRLIRYLDERAEHEGRWTGAIERHPAPLTVIWGDADPIARYAMVERLASRRPDATVVRLDGVGHYPTIEAPARVAAALAGALA